jgi:hypothetical protein
MKKLIFTLSTLSLLAFNASAQFCGPSGTSVCTAQPATGTPGLTPTSDTLPCILRGQAVDQIIFFENFSTFNLGGQNLTINSLKIDSIGNLPAGLCWKTNKANNTFAGGEVGCIRVTGTTTAASGQYKLKIIVDVATNIATLNNQDAESVASLRYYVRVSCAGLACPNVDTTTGKTSAFIAYNQTCPWALSIDENNTSISNLSILPNPFSSSATVKFVAIKDEPMTVKLSDILGATVMTKELEVVSGTNEFSINRAGYAPGVYLLSLTNGKATQTRRVVIE